MTKQITTIEKKASDFLRNLPDVLTTYAVRNYRMDQFIKSAMIAIIGNEKLQECLESEVGRASMINALRMGAGTGLSLNPQEGKAALIPYSKKINNTWIKTAQYQIMKNGLVELSLTSGKVSFITAETIHEKDDFSMSKTMDGDSYNFTVARKNRGDIDGFMAALKMNDGISHCKYMDISEMEEHRDKYAKNLSDKEGKLNADHAWNKSFAGMGEKTVLKKLLRSVHISQEIDNAVGSDDWEPEIKDVTPPQGKGTSSDDLTEKLETKKDQDTEEAVIESNPDDESPDAQEVQEVQEESVI